MRYRVRCRVRRNRFNGFAMRHERHGNRLTMRAGGENMAEKFVPKGKLSKKARKELDRQKRVTWVFSPVTKKVESKKLYSRKRKTQDREIY